MYGLKWRRARARARASLEENNEGEKRYEREKWSLDYKEIA